MAGQKQRLVQKSAPCLSRPTKDKVIETRTTLTVFSVKLYFECG